MNSLTTELFSLSGHVALVTGASRGIGRKCAEVLALAGAHVVMAARDAKALEAARDEIIAVGGNATALPLDVTDELSVAAAFEGMNRRGVVPDILVNNAGVIDRAPLPESTTQAWREVIEINLTAPYVISRIASVGMRRQGWGRIINVGSILSLQGKPRAHSYTATKHAIAGLTRSLCSELGRDGILVNAICPGYIRTELNCSLQEDRDFSNMVESRVPVGRWGETKDLAGPVLFLASPACDYVNGHLLVVDGGMTVTH
jgi:gluconate 5-dehydrogenase